MAIAARIALIDSDVRRRAAITFAIKEQGIHVEPFDSLTESSGLWDRYTHLMIHDDDNLSASAVIEELGEAGHWLPVVVFAENPVTERIVDAVLDGAVDYLAWPFGAADVEGSLHRVEARADGIKNVRIRHAMAHSLVRRLSAREREVLEGVAGGHSNRIIAEELEISPRTVEIHRANMLQKLGARHTSDAIRIALDAGLLDAPLLADHTTEAG